MALTKERLEGIRRSLGMLDLNNRTAPTMDGRWPLHQDCRELLEEVDRLRDFLGRISAVTDGYYDDGGEINPTVDAVDDLLVQALYPTSPAAVAAREKESSGA